jgi:hypothetical protein
MTNTSNRCVWPPDDLVHQNIPDSAKDFLQSRGLPFFVGDSSIEFGIYDSTDAFVIGQDWDYPIYITADGCVWHGSSDKDPGDQFMNSSVQHLDRFLDVYLSWFEKITDIPDDEVRQAAHRTIAALRVDDPPAFANDRWIWPLIWNDILNPSQ